MKAVKANVAIVGAGVAGCALAYSLGKRGQKVLLLEAGRVGRQGASAVPLALLNPNRGRSARASPADREALTAMWALVAELEALGLRAGAHRSGVLRVPSNARQAKGWRALHGMRWLAQEELPAGVHAPFGAMLVAHGGWLEPPGFLGALLTAAKRQGAQLQENTEVTRLERVDGKLLLGSAADSILAEAVVLCTGATPNPSLPLPPFERNAGEVICLSANLPMPLPLAGAVYAARSGSCVYVGGNHRPAHEDDPTAPAQLQRAASWFLPGLKEADCRSVFTGMRAKAEGGQPLLLELEPRLWFLGCFSGRGFLAAAHHAEVLAEKLVRQLGQLEQR